MNIAFTKMGPQGRQRIAGLVVSNVVSVYARSDAVVTLMMALDTPLGPSSRGCPRSRCRP